MGKAPGKRSSCSVVNLVWNLWIFESWKLTVETDTVEFVDSWRFCTFKVKKDPSFWSFLFVFRLRREDLSECQVSKSMIFLTFLTLQWLSVCISHLFYNALTSKKSVCNHSDTYRTQHRHNSNSQRYNISSSRGEEIL